MISESHIRKLIEEKIADTEYFLVDLTVSAANAINVEIDSPEGVKISDCVAVSRHIESNLDREENDFELSVSSAGVGRPFKVFQQYEKNVGKEVEVILSNGNKLQGELMEAAEDKITLKTSRKERIEGKKKKETIIEDKDIPMDEIKETKVIISFK